MKLPTFLTPKKVLLLVAALISFPVSSTYAQTIVVNNTVYDVANMASFSTGASTSMTFTVGATYLTGDKFTFTLSSGSFSASLESLFSDSSGGNWGLLNTTSNSATYRKTSGSLVSGGTFTIGFGNASITGASDPLLVSASSEDAIASPLESFTGVTLATTASAVPEPSTYAALAGVAVLGYVAIRRRRMRVV